MKTFVGLLVTIAVAAMALSVGSRVPPDSVAMGAGVLLGALTSIPVSLLMSVVLSRRGQPYQTIAEEAPHAAFSAPQPVYAQTPAYQQVRDYPPLVIINPSAYQAGSTARQPARIDSFPLLSGQREFRVVGEEAM